MTRQPKTNGLFTEDEFDEACRLILQVRRGYRRWSRLRKIRNGIVQRRRKKGRRAKSGQWWRRQRPPISFEIITIDEHHDSRRVMEALEKCSPKMRTNA